LRPLLSAQLIADELVEHLPDRVEPLTERQKPSRPELVRIDDACAVEVGGARKADIVHIHAKATEHLARHPKGLLRRGIGRQAVAAQFAGQTVAALGGASD